MSAKTIICGILVINCFLTAVATAQQDTTRELKVIFPVTCVAPGLANALEKLFEEEHKIPVKIYSLCTGDAIKFIKSHKGIDEVDVLIGHDLEAERLFEKEGYVVNLRSVWYSDYVLVGPPEDPAKIKGMTDPVKAMAILAKKKIPFCSRADSSGTHALELHLWKMTGIKPQGDWYIETRVGTSEMLMIAVRKKAYSISHGATFLEMAETVDLVPMVDDRKKLITTYEAMALNPDRFPNINYIHAMLFIGFLTSPSTQHFIAEFGREKYGRSTFWPMAVQTNQPQQEKK